MKKKISLFVIMLSMIVTFTACNKPETIKQESPVIGTPVEVTVVSKSLIKNEYVYSGKVKPVNEVNVLSTVNGTVDQVKFDVGAKVAANDLLFSMKTEDIINNINNLKASLKASEANVASARTTLEYVNGASMQSQIQSAKAAVANGEIGLSNAKLALDNAQNNYNNNKALYEVDAISKNALDQLEMAYNQAKNAYSQAQVAYEQAKNSYDILANKMPKENLEKAQAALKIAEASKGTILTQIQSAEKTLRDAEVKSPISGIVAMCNVKANTVLAQGSVPFTIIDMSKVNISVSVTEQVINAIKIGDLVEVKVSSISSEPIEAKITSINPVATSTGTYDVKIEINNAKEILKPGMLGEVYFTREKSENAIVLPRSSVLSKDNESYVFVEEKGLAKKVVVTTGVDNGNEIEVKSGIKENDKVITTGQNYVTDGATISIASNKKGE